MDNMEFKLTYSAKQQEEIKKIRDKYLPKEQAIDKMEELLRLDRNVSNNANAISLAVGIIGTLIMGIGMCCALVWNLFGLGIPIGIIGIALLCLAYPIYNAVIKKEREKIAPEILRLTDELMK